MLALFFAAAARLLPGAALDGVLDHSVLQ